MRYNKTKSCTKCGRAKGAQHGEYCQEVGRQRARALRQRPGVEQEDLEAEEPGEGRQGGVRTSKVLLLHGNHLVYADTVLHAKRIVRISVLRQSARVGWARVVDLLHFTGSAN